MLSLSHPRGRPASLGAIALVLAGALLSGCGERDEVLAEKVAKAEAAASRAERAARAAERAAKKLGAQPAAIVDDGEIDESKIAPDDDEVIEETADEGEETSVRYDTTIEPAPRVAAN